MKIDLAFVVSCFAAALQQVSAGSLNRLDQHVRHFESVSPITQRSRRSSDLSNDGLILVYKAFGLDFHLHLDSTNEEHVVQGNGAGKHELIKTNRYTGQLLDQPNSYVHGYVDNNNIFNGIIRTEYNKKYYIEPSEKFDMHHLGGSNVIYRDEDVDFDYLKGEEKAMEHLHNQLHLKSNGHPLSDPFFTQSKKVRRAARKEGPPTTTNNTCHFYVVGDHTLYDYYYPKNDNDETKTKQAMLNEMTTVMDEVNRIWSSTTWADTNTGVPIPQLKLKPSWFKLFTSKDDPKNPVATTRTSSGNEESSNDVLSDFAKYDFELKDPCLGHLFSSRDYASGVLGLAYVATPSGNQGVCGKRTPTSDGSVSLNTAISTNKNFGKIISMAVLNLVASHEVGHNFGSPHDYQGNPKCLPTAAGNNFLMFPSASDGRSSNNDVLSDCSVANITNVLVRRGENCFEAESAHSPCGNGKVEANETCDSGVSDGKCCDKTTCLFSDPTYECDPLTDIFGVCCNGDTCQIDASTDGKVCGKATECREERKCNKNNKNAPCEAGIAKVGICNQAFACDAGECPRSNSHTACTLYKVKSSGNPLVYVSCGSSDTDITIKDQNGGTKKVDSDCVLCCQENGTVNSKTLNDWVAEKLVEYTPSPGQESNSHGFFASDKTCQDGNIISGDELGYCNGEGKCHVSDEQKVLDDVLSGLEAFLTSPHLDAAFEFIKDNWFYFVIGFGVLCAIFVGVFFWQRHQNKSLERDIEEKHIEMKQKKAERDQRYEAAHAGKNTSQVPLAQSSERVLDSSDSD